MKQALTNKARGDSKQKIAVHENQSLDTFHDSSLMQPPGIPHTMHHNPSFGLTDKLRKTYGGGGGFSGPQRNDKFHVTATPFTWKQQPTSVDFDSSMLASGVHFYD